MGHTKRPAAAWHGDNQRQRRHRLGSDLAGVSPRMAGRCHQHWRVPSDHLGLKVGIRRRPAVHDAKVDRAAQQRLGGLFLDLGPHAGGTGGKMQQLGHQQASAQGLRRRHPDRAYRVVGVATHLVQGIVGQGQQLAGHGQFLAVVVADQQRVGRRFPPAPAHQRLPKRACR